MTEYIDRKKIIDIIEEDIRQCREDAENAFGDESYLQAVRSRENGVHYILNAIRYMQIADVMPIVHGEWITHSQPSAYENIVWYTCSLCGREEDDNTDTYCPNCGAKMDKEVE